MGKKSAAQKTEAKAAPKSEIDAVPGFVGRVIKPGQTLSWGNEVEEFVLQLNSAALGPKVLDGRTTLFAAAKGSETALCTLAPKSAEQWNLTHTFTAFDGPVDFRCEGVNEIHLTGFIDVQEEEESEDEHEHGEECGDECAHGHDGEEFDDADDSDDDDEVMIFGDQSGSSDDDEDDEDEEEDNSDRFEVIEERSHGEGWASKDDKKPAVEKKGAAVEKTPAKKDVKKKTEASPAKETKATVLAKKESPAVKKADAKSEKKAAEKEKKIAEKIAELTATTNSKKRPAPSESVEVPKKAKNLREHKGVTIEEHAVGKGQPVQRGRKVSILYKGRLTNGKQFDASQNRKKPFSFRHGIGDVIKGMDIGIEGMRSGGKRTITIPSKLGYGKSGAPPTIPGNSTLIFDIELL